jgi:uncharacterized coiled-coil protein SlyX
MPTVSLTEAARLAGVSRKTVQRRVSDGVLSVSHGVQGEKTVEISELIRVFGELPGHGVQAVHRTESTPVHGHVQGVQPDIATLEARIQGLEAVVESKDETIASQAGQIDELRQEKRELRAQVAGLLEDRRQQRPPEPPAPAPAPAPVQVTPDKPTGSTFWNAVPLALILAVALFVLVFIVAQLRSTP